MTDWDGRFITLAEHVAGWSKDPSTKVGAVVVINKRIKSTGFNGLPSSLWDRAERLDDRDIKLEMTIHAEENAIMQANEVGGATIYISHPPCLHCAMLMIQSGIKRVAFREPTDDYLSRWGDQHKKSIEFFLESNVSFDSIPTDAETGNAHLTTEMAALMGGWIYDGSANEGEKIIEAARAGWRDRLVRKVGVRKLDKKGTR